MKRFAILAALVVACLISACASTTTASSDAGTTENMVSQVKMACAVVQPTITSLQVQNALLTADQIIDLTTAAALADKVCSVVTVVGETVDTTSVSNFVSSGFPVVIGIVNAAPLDAASKASALAALTVAQVALSAVLAQ